ncbi:MAG: hypothetical protein ACREIU_07635 [Planctomycetota bacterium]
MLLPLRWTLPAAFLLPVRLGPQGPEREIQDLLSGAHALPEVRAEAARKVADLGLEAMAALEQAAVSGNEAEARFALVALSHLAEERLARAVLVRALRGREHPEVRLLAAVSLSFASGTEAEAALAETLEDARGGSVLRAACGMALGRTGLGSVRERCAAILERETDPLVAGALAMGFGLAGEEAAIARLEERLPRAREAPERSGLFLALGALDRRQVPAIGDLASTDPVLPHAAALHFADEPVEESAAAAWRKALADPALGAVLYAALGRGEESRSRMRLTEGVREQVGSAVRAAIYGAAAARRETPLLLALRADPEDRARLFSGAALFVLSGGAVPPSFERTLAPAALEAIAHPSDPSAVPAALLLAALRIRDAREPLARWALAGGAGAEVADLARKALTGDLEEAALRALVRAHAFDRGLLFERAVAEGVQRFAEVALGGASEYLARRRERSPSVPRAWIGSGRTPPRDAPLYEDLWMILARRPFDEPLRGPR